MHAWLARVASVISIDGIFSVDNHGCIRCRARFSFWTHRSLHKDAPIFRPIQQIGIIRSHPILGGFISITSGSEFSVHTGQEAATGLGVKADAACCSGYLWY
jgi:hypothetical protein